MKSERNYGIDLCRILAICLVLLGHMIWNGGLMAAAGQQHIPDGCLRGFDAVASCNINLFALISGFVGITSRHRLSSIVSLWVQLVFCSLVIVGVFSAIDGKMPERFLPIIMPVTYSTWWYFTAYFALFFVMPIINTSISKIDKRIASQFLLLILFFGVSTWFTRGDPFRLNGGATFAWLLMLYIVGALLRVYPIKLSARSCFLIATISIIIASLRSEIMSCLPFMAQNATKNCSHVSPFVYIASVFTVLGFSKLKIVNGKIIGIIRYLAPTVFGAYILHTHPLVWSRIWRGAFAGIVKFENSVVGVQLILIVSLLFIPVFLFLVLSLIERMRMLLFDVVGLNKLIKRTFDGGCCVEKNIN